MTSSADLLDFFQTCGKLKTLERQGWLRYDIADPESVADHSWRLGMLCLVIGSGIEGAAKPDISKMLQMALLHDLAEVEVGDITPRDGVTPEEKLRLEAGAMKKILEKIDDTGELYQIWSEYAAGESREAKLVFALDKLEMALQAKEYEQQGTEGLREFYSIDESELPEELVREILQEVIRR
jgi:putative hydrolase of HD superfamily